MQKIAILYDASQAVLSTFDLDEVLQRILVIARDYFHLQNVAILLLDEESNELRVRSQIGWESGLADIRVPLGQGLTGAAAQQKRPVYAPDVSKDPYYIGCEPRTRSEVAIPLRRQGKVIGAVTASHEQEDGFSPEQLRLLQTRLKEPKNAGSH